MPKNAISIELLWGWNSLFSKNSRFKHLKIWSRSQPKTFYFDKSIWLKVRSFFLCVRILIDCQWGNKVPQFWKVSIFKSSTSPENWFHSLRRGFNRKRSICHMPFDLKSTVFVPCIRNLRIWKFQKFFANDSYRSSNSCFSRTTNLI